MKALLYRFFALWGLLVGLMVVMRILFVMVEPAYGWSDVTVLPAILWHALPMDLSMSAYLMFIPGLILAVSIWLKNERWITAITRCYFGLIAFLLGATFVLDAALFPFWNFRLDSTPLFYFFTSPGAAMASLPWWVEVLLFVLTGAVIYGLYRLLNFVWFKIKLCLPSRRVLATAGMVLLTGLLIIPVRGGITVSTMTTGRGFFSNDMRLNHATINPLFSLMYSLTHSDNLDSQYRFFEENKLNEVFSEVNRLRSTDSIPELSLTTSTPDIYVIILESFSSGLMPSLGGEEIAVHLNNIAEREGILFTDFYAESFRTDRALPVILSGYPAMPTASVMRYTNKLGQMPGLASTLKNKGWKTNYYYGGDINFTNMKAYLVATGFDNIVADTDFEVGERLSKWGVHDGPVFDRVLKELKSKSDKPRFTVIQTSSSHEPFDVPFTKFEDKKKNAFAYSDDCVNRFINGLKVNGSWSNSLVIIVPDHWGAYPEDLTDYRARHHVPLIITGGAIKGAPAQINRPGSQSDMAPTLLGLLGVDSKDFVFGKNLLDKDSPAFAWITEPDWFGIVTTDGHVVVTNDGNILDAEGAVGSNPDLAKAIVQKIYTDFSKR